MSSGSINFSVSKAPKNSCSPSSPTPSATPSAATDAVFHAIGAESRETACPGLEGLMAEKRSAEAEGLSPELRDLNTLLAALQIERYETSAYETLGFLAQQMGHRDAARLLRETLREEQETAKLVLELLKASKLHWTEGMAEDAASEAPRRRRAA
jgi:ferritin-like metal-binding protein YciE